MTAEQKAHVLAQLCMAETAVNSAKTATAPLCAEIISNATLCTIMYRIRQARERLEIAQYAIEGLIKEGR